MRTDQTLSVVCALIAGIFECPPETLNARTRLMTDLPCESIDLLELGAGLNRAFRIDVDDELVFLRSLRVHAERFRHDGLEAGLAAEYPHLSRERIRELAEGLALADAAPLLRIGDIAAYAAHALEQGRA